jgi:hypothetical protein
MGLFVTVLASGDESVRFEVCQEPPRALGQYGHAPALREMATKAGTERIAAFRAYALAMLNDEADRNVALLEEGLKSRRSGISFLGLVYLGEVGMPGFAGGRSPGRARSRTWSGVRREMDIAAAPDCRYAEKDEREGRGRALDRISAEKPDGEGGRTGRRKGWLNRRVRLIRPEAISGERDAERRSGLRMSRFPPRMRAHSTPAMLTGFVRL